MPGAQWCTPVAYQRTREEVWKKIEDHSWVSYYYSITLNINLKLISNKLLYIYNHNYKPIITVHLLLKNEFFTKPIHQYKLLNRQDV